MSHDLAAPIPGAPAIDPQAASVVLDRLQDAGNVGSILRSAAAFGLRQVIALKGTAALWSPKVLRAGMGAHFGLQLHEGLPLLRLDVAQMRQALYNLIRFCYQRNAPLLWLALSQTALLLGTMHLLGMLPDWLRLLRPLQSPLGTTRELFMDLAGREWSRSRRYGTGAALLLLSGLACHAQNPQTPPSAQLPGPTTSPIPGGPPLETRVFEIWPDFLSKGSGQSDPNDPFVADSPPAKPTFKVVLEQLGIEFTTPGSKVIRGPGRNEITVTNTKEQLHNTETVLYQKFGQGPPRQGQVHLEVFSMPPLVARKSLLAHPKESDLYTWIEAELAKPGSAVKLERHSITIVRGGLIPEYFGRSHIGRIGGLMSGIGLLAQLPRRFGQPAVQRHRRTRVSQSRYPTCAAGSSARCAPPSGSTPAARPAQSPPCRGSRAGHRRR